MLVSPFIVKEFVRKKEIWSKAGAQGDIASINGSRIAALHRHGRHCVKRFGQEAYLIPHTASTAANTPRKPNGQLIRSLSDPPELWRRHHCRHGLHVIVQPNLGSIACIRPAKRKEASKHIAASHARLARRMSPSGESTARS